MVFIALSQIFFISLLAGVGRLLWAGFRFEVLDNPFLLPWLGFFTASIFTMGYALFWPVDEIPFFVFVFCGLSGLLLIWRDLCQTPQRMPNVPHWFWGILIVLFLTLDYTTAVKTWGMLEGDTGYYHATMVRWLNEYGTVSGLANLHTLLGNVSSWFDFAALIEAGPWQGRSAAVLPGIGLICGLMYFLYEIICGESKVSKVYALVFFCYILILLHRYNRPTLYYDFPALILNGIVVSEALKVMLQRVMLPLSRLCIPTFLVASAFTIKTIPVVSVMMVSGMILWLLWRDSRITMRNLLCIFGLPVVAAAVWLSSNAILSGYLLFPLTVATLPVDWLPPSDQVQAAYDAVRGWGRLPGENYILALNSGTWFWLKPWLMRVPVDYPGVVTMPFLLGLGGWGYTLWQRKGDKRGELFFLLWTGLGIVYWFVMAPDMRFGGGLLWSFAACAVAFAVPDSWLWRAVWVQRSMALLLAITTLALFVRAPVWRDTGPQWWGIPPMPSGSVIPYKVHNGSQSFDVWIRLDGSSCMNSPLPCTPAPSQNIRLRNPLDMGAGFAPLNPHACCSR